MFTLPCRHRAIHEKTQVHTKEKKPRVEKSIPVPELYRIGTLEYIIKLIMTELNYVLKYGVPRYLSSRS